MNTKLITALRTAATALEHGTFNYSWNREYSCNNGVLFCALTGQSAAQLKKRVPGDINGKYSVMTWREIVGQHCPVAGVSTDDLLREVMSCGLTQTDIVNLETLSDARVLARMKVPDVVLLPRKTKRCWPKFWRKAEYGPKKYRLPGQEKRDRLYAGLGGPSHRRRQIRFSGSRGERASSESRKLRQQPNKERIEK